MIDCTAALRELAAEVRALRAEVAALAPPPRRALAPSDRAWLALLLPAIDAAAGDAVLTTAELAGLALRPSNAALAAAMARHAHGAGGLRAMGKRLSRCCGHVVAGLELRHVGNASGAALWQCVGLKLTRNPGNIRR